MLCKHGCVLVATVSRNFLGEGAATPLDLNIQDCGGITTITVSGTASVPLCNHLSFQPLPRSRRCGLHRCRGILQCGLALGTSPFAAVLVRQRPGRMQEVGAACRAASSLLRRYGARGVQPDVVTLQQIQCSCDVRDLVVFPRCSVPNIVCQLVESVLRVVGQWPRSAWCLWIPDRFRFTTRRTYGEFLRGWLWGTIP